MSHTVRICTQNRVPAVVLFPLPPRERNEYACTDLDAPDDTLSCAPGRKFEALFLAETGGQKARDAVDEPDLKEILELIVESRPAPDKVVQHKMYFSSGSSGCC